MRIAWVLLAVVLLAATVPAPASSATKYKPCTLLTTADLEGALKAKVTRSQLEDEEPPDTEGPFKGEVLDGCSWILGSGAIGVVLRVTRAVASVPQMAANFFTPLDETARKGGSVVAVKVAGAECRIYGEIKMGHSTNCLTAGKGLALAIEINTHASTPVPAAVAQGLLRKAAARLP